MDVYGAAASLLCVPLLTIDLCVVRMPSPPIAQVLYGVVASAFLGGLVLPLLGDRWRSGETGRPFSFVLGSIAGLMAVAGACAMLALSAWRLHSIPLGLAGVGLFAVVTAALRPIVDLARAVKTQRLHRHSQNAIFPGRFRTRMPLPPAVSITHHDGRSANGFLIGADGLIATAHHVVHGQDSVWVTLLNGDVFEGRIVARRPEWDLGLVRIEAP
jgi:S1-C subfamily serine protease